MIAGEGKNLSMQIMESSPAFLGDHKKITCADIAVALSDLSRKGESSAYCVTDTGILICLNEEKVLEKWVDLKMAKGTCLTIQNDLIACGGTDGIVRYIISLPRFFETGTLKYRGTLPKPDPIFTDLTTGKPAASLKIPLTDAKYPYVLCLAFQLTECMTLSVLYSNKCLIIWDISDFKNCKRKSTEHFHSNCVWGLEVRI